jgi:phage pi2 protein 07
MKAKKDLGSLSNAEIVALFEKLCIEQYDAMEREEQARVNRLVWQIHDLETELKSRPGDQRYVLKELFGHPNMQVRLSAAQANLAIDYASARRELQAIVDSQWFPQAGDAGITLENIDTGFYKPQ